MSSLFIREPETLDGYVPKFTAEELLFGYKTEQIQIGGGFKDFDFDPNNIDYLVRTTITVAGVKITSDKNYYMNAMDTIATMINEFVEKTKNPEITNWLKENSVELNRSNRYWHAKQHVDSIEKQKKEVARLQAEIQRAEWIASMRAVEVKSGRLLSQEEKTLLLAEFSGGDYKEIP